jgi:hypothetical protein
MRALHGGDEVEFISLHELATILSRLDSSEPGPAFEVMGVKGPDGKPLPIKGKYVNTIVTKNGAWQLASNARVTPPPAPAQ